MDIAGVPCVAGPVDDADKYKHKRIKKKSEIYVIPSECIVCVVRAYSFTIGPHQHNIRSMLALFFIVE